MNNKPNLPNEIFWGKEYSWRMDSKVNGWLALAAVISSLADIIFAHTVKQWPWKRASASFLRNFSRSHCGRAA
jgi:hypothetical protein